jgi:hypothetical protein
MCWTTSSPNATRVAPPGTAITLSARHRGDRIELHVTDQGPGMPQEERRRAFDRFWRKNGSDGDGFGLGLAIVRRLAVASGGTAELRAADHGGVDAVITLPVSTTPKTPATHNRPHLQTHTRLGGDLEPRRRTDCQNPYRALQRPFTATPTVHS